MQSDTDLNAVLNETVEKHESGLPKPWAPNLSDELKAKLYQSIVGFEIEITQISKEDQDKMLQVLQNSGDAESIRLAKLMKHESSPSL